MKGKVRRGTGGPCNHCGRTCSPCWRKGPPEKPVLCNACGARYLVKRNLDGYMPGQKAGGIPRELRHNGGRFVCDRDSSASSDRSTDDRRTISSSRGLSHIRGGIGKRRRFRVITRLPDIDDPPYGGACEDAMCIDEPYTYGNGMFRNGYSDLPDYEEDEDYLATMADVAARTLAMLRISVPRLGPAKKRLFNHGGVIKPMPRRYQIVHDA